MNLNTDINIATNKKIDIAEHATIAQCPACGVAGDARMHIEPVTDAKTVRCSCCGAAGSLFMVRRIYHCDTCAVDREGDGECEECGPSVPTSRETSFPSI